MTERNIGQIVQVIGPVVDVRFQPGKLPPIKSAVSINDVKKKISVVAEIAQHLGNDTARCIAMSSTDGLVRSMEVLDDGGPISVPVGKEVLGRIFNLLGKPIDTKEDFEAKNYLPIHRAPPSFEERETTTTVLETGLKVIDLLAPFARGGKIGLFGGA
ncbi:MAG: F0F1 ATP synthase subunit beta, partial [Candidatus Kuenenia stuttgartiensis]|nr:F0F1 ATP synthase subunit beta [Candidatus Kuenenia stuttgartiensis]